MSNELELAEENLHHAEEKLHKAEVETAQAIREIDAAEAEIEKAVHRTIHFTVDGEPCQTRKHELTPNEIITEYGKQPIEIGTSRRLWVVRARAMRGVEMIQSGCTTVCVSRSFRSVQCRCQMGASCGIAGFVEGLRELGYEPAALPGMPDHITFSYIVGSGRFAGTAVRVGFIVPPQFPEGLPTGMHVSPQLLPMGLSGGHPAGGIHHQHALPFERGAGGAWQYWSRPYDLQAWTSTKRTPGTYMAHIAKLWDTQ